MQLPITLYCDISGAVSNSREPRTHKKGKHIERKYHLISDIMQRGDVVVTKITSANNLEDPFTKSLPAKTFDRHVDVWHHGFESKWKIVRAIYTKSHFIVMDVYFILIYIFFISIQ